MPFTTSHPAVVLPLKQLFPRYFSLTGLMAGAMSPDLLYFLIFDTANRGFSHSWTGLFIFCVPAGVAFSFAFHKLLKFNLIMNLPRPLDLILSGLVFQRFRVSGFRPWAILILSVLIGALSHFFWDSFTHAHGEIAKAIPFLLEESTIFGITRQNCTFLQHLSTILGAVFIPVYIIKARLIPGPKIANSVKSPGQKRWFWLWSTIAVTIFAVIVTMIKMRYYDFNLYASSRLAYQAKILGLAGWAGFFYCLCLYTLISKPGIIQKD